MDIEKEIELLKARNARVEKDKAWEVSWTRKITIGITTYIVASVWLVMIRDVNPFLKALVPVVGYLLSTLSIPVIKRWWISGHE